MKTVKTTLIVLATLAVVAVVIFFGIGMFTGFAEASKKQKSFNAELNITSKAIELTDKSVHIGMLFSKTGRMEDVKVHDDCDGYDDGRDLYTGKVVKLLGVETFDDKPACAQIEYDDSLLGNRKGFVPYNAIKEFQDIAETDPLLK